MIIIPIDISHYYLRSSHIVFLLYSDVKKRFSIHVVFHNHSTLFLPNVSDRFSYDEISLPSVKIDVFKNDSAVDFIYNYISTYTFSLPRTILNIFPLFWVIKFVGRGKVAKLKPALVYYNKNYKNYLTRIISIFDEIIHNT